MAKPHKHDLINKIALQIAERIREKATKQGRIPFLSGDLRKSLVARKAIQKEGPGETTITSPLVYARAVHDGRPRIKIKPKKKPYLVFMGKDGHLIRKKEVIQPARKGKPFIQEAINEMNVEGFDFLNPTIEENLDAQIGDALTGTIDIDIQF